ncbi:MAG: flagellar hook-associated protein FlgK [Anaerolineales bacterium]|nr:flagellar hook-associated protein FlgK [Anaerolineales bacterium]
MSNLLNSIRNAASSMTSYQQMIQVIQHNVANASTEGYRRQEAVMTTGIPTSTSRTGGNYVGQMGTGVIVSYIKQYGQAFLDAQVRSQLAQSAKWEKESDILSQVEATLDEIGDAGLLNMLDAFWTGWQTLSDDPSNISLRTSLKQAAQDLADAFNNRVTSLRSIRQDQDTAIIQAVDEINAIATQVADLNTEIMKAIGADEAPNDLIDERERQLDRLAEITGGTVKYQETGEALVTLGGHALVIGSEAFTLTTSRDAANDNMVEISWLEDGADYTATSGELAGLFEVRDEIIPEQLSGLSDLADELATAVNDQHALGYDLNGIAGGDFFDYTYTSATFFRLDLSSNLDDVENIAAASVTNAPGDGNNATEMANLKDLLAMNTGSTTFNDYYNNQITAFGLLVQQASTKSSDTSVVLDSLKQLQASESGVSLDEEAASLINAQKAYEACARVLTTIDEMLNVLINNTGLVGR